MADPTVQHPTGGWADASQTGDYPKITSIFDFTDEALGQLKLKMEQLGFNIPVSSIVGFSQYTAKADEVAAEEGTTSATFTDLATVGPQVTGLPAGKYVLLFGASLQAPAAQTLYMGVSVNGAAVSATHVVENQVATNASLAHGMLIDLATPDSSVVAKYRISGGGVAGNARYRWIIMFRYANK